MQSQIYLSKLTLMLLYSSFSLRLFQFLRSRLSVSLVSHFSWLHSHFTISLNILKSTRRYIVWRRFSRTDRSKLLLIFTLFVYSILYMESSFSESTCDFNDHTALMKESKDSSQQASTVKDLRKMLPDTCRVTLLKGAQWARSFSHLSSCSIVLSVTHCSSFSDFHLISSITLLHCFKFFVL